MLNRGPETFGQHAQEAVVKGQTRRISAINERVSTLPFLDQEEIDVTEKRRLISRPLENLHQTIKKTTPLNNTYEIDTLGLNLKQRNILIKHNITTIAALEKYLAPEETESGLEGMHQLGPKSIGHIKERYDLYRNKRQAENPSL